MIRLERAVMKALGWILSILIFIMMIDIFTAVLVRYVFHSSLNFTEELGRYLFVWIVFLGMARCIGNDRHVALDLLSRSLKGTAARLLAGLIHCFCVCFFIALTWGGFALCQLGTRQKSATMRIPMNKVYLCIPLCGILCIFFLLLKIGRLIRPAAAPALPASPECSGKEELP